MDANNPLGMSGFFHSNSNYSNQNQYNPTTQTSSSAHSTYGYNDGSSQPSFISGGFQSASSYEGAAISSTWSPIGTQAAPPSNRGYRGGRGGSFGFGSRPPRPKQPREQQLFYCEVCRISCAGAQPYQEHLVGQKHKKKAAKEASSEGAAVSSSTARYNPLYCEVCDVACSAPDIFAAHTRGAKHFRAVNLYTLLGKPIPEKKDLPPPPVPTVPTARPSSVAARQDAPTETNGDTSAAKESVIVGAEYLDEVKNEKGTIVSYTCKLCECSFTDPGAKNMHLKGRRHQISYKKKVDSSYRIDAKPNSSRLGRIQDERMRQRSNREDFWRAEAEMGQRRFEMEMARGLDFGPWPVGGFMPQLMNFPVQPPIHRRNTIEDAYMTNKQTAIYPKENELAAIHSIVTSCEKALKLVSDAIAEEDSAKAGGDVKSEPEEIKLEDGKAAEEGQVKDLSKVVDMESLRALKGAMRVGTLSKGLILSGDQSVDLVVLCAYKPTVTLLNRVAGLLPTYIDTVGGDKKYSVETVMERAAIVVTSLDPESNISLTMTLTSPVIREEEEDSATVTADPPDMLNKEKALEALAELRHAKWFQVRAGRLRSCVIVIRILRDMSRRNATWNALSEWAQELLVEKCICFAGMDIGPGEALRSVFECISSGLILPDGPGLYDPCEKEPTDVLANLSSQQREDITAVAQMAMRYITFRQIHKVLEIEKMPKRPYRNRTPNKRRMSSQEVSETGAEDKKMKEEQEGGVKTE